MSLKAAEVLKLFVDDIPTDDLEGIAKRAYTYPKFSREELVPVTELGDGLSLQCPGWRGCRACGS